MPILCEYCGSSDNVRLVMTDENHNYADECENCREISGHTPISLTCDECDLAASCKFAFDPYNTDGSCLDSK